MQRPIALFVPNVQFIADITQSNPAVVTTQQPHGYPDQIFVRLRIPENFGMSELDGKICEIVVLDSMSFAIDLDTSSYPPYFDPGGSQVAQVVPVGEANDTLLGAVHNNLPPRVAGGAS